MGTVQHWTGREARALRTALRMSVRSFAAYLGVSDRTVSKWEAGGERIAPTQDSQALLDTAYVQADADVRSRFHTALGTPEASVDRAPDHLALVPTREPGLVDRTDELDAIVSVVEEAAAARGIGTVAVCGPGGFGKTTLATQAGHDPRIRGLFSDILWVETGEDCSPARIVELIADLCVHLGEPRPAFTEPEQAGFHLAHVLRDRRVLLVVDNVWSAVDLAPFLLGGENCVRLVTTRNLRTCPTGTRVIRVGPMTAAEMAELLTRNVPGLAQPDTAILARMCGGWPLLASVIGANVTQDIASGAPAGRAAAETGSALRDYGPQAFDVWDSDQRRNAIGHAITASLDSLEKSVAINGVSGLRERYLSLAVFPPAVPIPLQVLTRWWGGMNGWTPMAVRQFCRILADRSLISAYLADRDAVLLHDVFRAYLRRSIDGQWTDLHRSLLDAHRPPEGDPWRTLDPTHAYLWRHLPYHLHEAGLDDELTRLLADPAFVVAKVLRVGHQPLSDDAAVLERVANVPDGLLDRALTLARSGYLLHGLTTDADLSATLTVALERAHPSAGAQSRPVVAPLSVNWARDAAEAPSDGHVGAITSVATAAHLVSSGGEDGVVRVWDATERTQLHALRGHTGWVFTTALSADAQLLASAGDDGVIRLWDTQSGVPVAVLPGHQRRVRSVVFARGGELLVSGAEDGRIHVWDTAQGTLLRSMKTGGTPLWTVAVDDRAKYVAAAGEDEFVRLFALDSGELLDEQAGHRDWVRSVAFAGDGSLLASGSGDRSVAVWSVADGKLALLRRYSGLSDRVRSVSFAGADTVLAATERPELVLLAPDGEAASTRLPRGVDWVRSTALADQQDAVVAGCEDGAIRLWSPTGSGRRPLELLAAGRNTVWSVQFARSGSLILTGDGAGAVDLLSPETGENVGALAAGAGRVWSLATGGDRAAAACGDGAVRLWSLEGEQPVRVLNTDVHRTWCVGLPASGDLLAATTGDGSIRCWSLPGEELLWEQDARVGRLRSIAFDHAGDLLAASGGDGTVRVWRGRTGEHVSRFTNPAGWARTVAVDSGGERLAIGAGSGDIHVRSLDADKFVAHLPGHTGRVLMLAFIEGTDLIVSAAADGTVRLWSLPEQRQVAQVRVDASLHCAAFDETTRRVVAGSAAGIVTLSLHTDRPSPGEAADDTHADR